MSYVTNQLARGEDIVFESGPHWFSVVGRTWLWIVASILFLAVLIYFASPPDEGFDQPVEILALGVLLLCFGRIGWVVWGWRNTLYLVTSRRIIEADGIFNKHMASSSLEKVNDAHLSQSWLGRIFNYGDLDILTAADDAGIADFPMLADPVQFKVAMLNQKEMLDRPDLAAPAYQRQPSPPPLERVEPMPPRAGSDRVTVVPPPPPPADPTPAPVAAPAPSAIDETAATIERLANLRDQGLITEAEYEAKKRELLGRI